MLPRFTETTGIPVDPAWNSKPNQLYKLSKCESNYRSPWTIRPSYPPTGECLKSIRIPTIFTAERQGCSKRSYVNPIKSKASFALIGNYVIFTENDTSSIKLTLLILLTNIKKKYLEECYKSFILITFPFVWRLVLV